MISKILYLLWRGPRHYILIIKHIIIQICLKYKLKALNVTYGDNIVAYNSIPSIMVNGKGRIEIGKRFIISSYAETSWCSKSKIIVKNNGILRIGDNSGINGSLIVCSKSVTIGNNVEIGGGTKIYDTNFHSLNYEERRDLDLDGKNAISLPVVIEDDVFVGTGCIIGKGVTIGARTIIAAGSVVVKNIPPDCIAGGNPCKIIKKLF